MAVKFNLELKGESSQLFVVFWGFFSNQNHVAAASSLMDLVRTDVGEFRNLRIYLSSKLPSLLQAALNMHEYTSF